MSFALGDPDYPPIVNQHLSSEQLAFKFPPSDDIFDDLDDYHMLPPRPENPHGNPRKSTRRLYSRPGSSQSYITNKSWFSHDADDGHDDKGGDTDDTLSEDEDVDTLHCSMFLVRAKAPSSSPSITIIRDQAYVDEHVYAGRLQDETIFLPLEDDEKKDLSLLDTQLRAADKIKATWKGYQQRTSPTSARDAVDATLSLCTKMHRRQVHTTELKMQAECQRRLTLEEEIMEANYELQLAETELDHCKKQLTDQVTYGHIQHEQLLSALERLEDVTSRYRREETERKRLEKLLYNYQTKTLSSGHSSSHVKAVSRPPTLRTSSPRSPHSPQWSLDDKAGRSPLPRTAHRSRFNSPPSSARLSTASSLRL